MLHHAWRATYLCSSVLVGSGSGVGVAISYGWALLAIGFRLVDPDKELPAS